MFDQLDNTFLMNNSLTMWIYFLGLFLILFFLIKTIELFAEKKLQTFAKETLTITDDVFLEILRSTRLFFKAGIAAYLAIQVLHLSQDVEKNISKVFIVIALIQLAIWGSVLIRFWMETIIKKRAVKDPSVASTLDLVNFVAKVILYSLIGMMILNNLGVNVTALIAGLGVGGIAIGLAMQNILGDLFSSLAIVLDKPFVVGDAINVGEFNGDIERIGIKTTRLRSLTGEQLIFSNSDLLQSRIRNFKRMDRRRVVFNINVTYGTKHEQLKKIPAIVKQTIEKQKSTQFDRCHFVSFDLSAIKYEVVFYVTTADYNTYMDVQQSINLDLFEIFEHEKIQFAYSSLMVRDKDLATPDPYSIRTGN